MRARIEETQHRHGPRGLEPLAPPGEGGTHVHYIPSKQTGLGCITSRPKSDITFFELLAFRLGCNIETAKAAYFAGLIK